MRVHEARSRRLEGLPLPDSKNVWQRLHWAARARTKKLWEKHVWALVNESPRMPRPIARVRCDLLIVWKKRGPLPDLHNLDMAHECIADGIVKAGILEDDSHGQYWAGETIVRRADGSLAPGTYAILSWDPGDEGKGYTHGEGKAGVQTETDGAAR